MRPDLRAPAKSSSEIKRSKIGLPGTLNSRRCFISVSPEPGSLCSGKLFPTFTSSSKLNLERTSSTVVDHLSSWIVQQKNQRLALCYSYLDYQAQSDQTTYKLLRSLLKQLLSALGEVPSTIGSSLEKAMSANSLSEAVVAGFVLECCRNFDRLFLCIDALDECGDLPGFLTAVSRLPANVSVFMTGRYSVQDITKRLFHTARVMEIRASQEDVGAFLQSRLDADTLMDPGLMDPDTRGDIMEKLPKTSDGR